ncbi:hypothetical protein H2203_007351 [Taxawa tesnikishii (nom. ined.)]|nr:hypothetical protein H2203_007351 [Dothideales sp. JES 119]
MSTSGNNERKPPYSELPLPNARSTRVLALCPETSSTLVCELSVVLVDDDPAYEALSYTWATEDGDYSLSSQIYCNGCQLNVTRNCYAALRRLRLSSEKRTLWVDAICIDQTSDREKAQQVKLMGDIYRKSPRALVWLGESIENSEAALLFLERLAAARRSSQELPSLATHMFHKIVTEEPANVAEEFGLSFQDVARLAKYVKPLTLRSEAEYYLRISGQRSFDTAFGRVNRDGWSPIHREMESLFHRTVFQCHLRDHAPIADAPFKKQPECKELIEHVHHQTPVRNAIKDIFRQTWWQRVWTLQEVSLAPKVLLICGDATVDFALINQFSEFILARDTPFF